VRLSEASSPAKPLEVPFPSGAVLHITYRVPEYTPNQASALVNEASKDPKRMGEMTCRVVESWDLEDENGEVYPLIPDVVADKIHLGVLGAIMKAVNADQMPGEAEETSSAG
jgi:hypothetical protein